MISPEDEKKNIAEQLAKIAADKDALKAAISLLINKSGTPPDDADKKTAPRPKSAREKKKKSEQIEVVYTSTKHPDAMGKWRLAYKQQGLGLLQLHNQTAGKKSVIENVPIEIIEAQNPGITNRLLEATTQPDSKFSLWYTESPFEIKKSAPVIKKAPTTGVDTSKKIEHIVRINSKITLKGGQYYELADAPKSGYKIVEIADGTVLLHEFKNGIEIDTDIPLTSTEVKEFFKTKPSLQLTTAITVGTEKKTRVATEDDVIWAKDEVAKIVVGTKIFDVGDKAKIKPAHVVTDIKEEEHGGKKTTVYYFDTQPKVSEDGLIEAFSLDKVRREHTVPVIGPATITPAIPPTPIIPPTPPSPATTPVLPPKIEKVAAKKKAEITPEDTSWAKDEVAKIVVGTKIFDRLADDNKNRYIVSRIRKSRSGKMIYTFEKDHDPMSEEELVTAFADETLQRLVDDSVEVVEPVVAPSVPITVEPVPATTPTTPATVETPAGTIAHRPSTMAGTITERRQTPETVLATRNEQVRTTPLERRPEQLLDDARTEYGVAYKKLLGDRQLYAQEKRGFWGKIKTKLFGEKVASEDLPANHPSRIAFENAKQSYEDAKIFYGRELYQKEQERLQAQTRKSPEAIERDLQSAKLAIWSKLILGELHPKNGKLAQIQIESLPKKEQGILEKGLRWYGGIKPSGWRILASFGIGITTAALTGGVSTLGVAAVGVAGRLGLGLAAGGLGVSIKNRFINQKKIEKNFEQRRGSLALESKTGGDFSKAWLVEQENKFKELLKQKKKSELKNHILNASIRGAAMIGAGIAAGSYLDSLQPESLEDATGTFDPNTEPERPVAPITPGNPTIPSTPGYTPETVQVSSRGFIETIKNLQEQYTSTGKPLPPALDGDPTSLAIKYDFYNPNDMSESATVWKGSTLGIDAKGDLVLHDIQTGQDSLVNTPEGFEGKYFDYEGARATAGTDDVRVILKGHEENLPKMGAEGALPKMGATEISTTGEQSSGLPKMGTEQINTTGNPDTDSATTIAREGQENLTGQTPVTPLEIEAQVNEKLEDLVDTYFGTKNGGIVTENSGVHSQLWKDLQDSPASGSDGAFKMKGGDLVVKQITDTYYDDAGKVITDSSVASSDKIKMTSFLEAVAKEANTFNPPIRPEKGQTIEAFAKIILMRGIEK